MRIAATALLLGAVAWGWAEAALSGRASDSTGDAERLAQTLVGLPPGEVALVPATLVGLGTPLDALPIYPVPLPATPDLAGRYASVLVVEDAGGDAADAWAPERLPAEGANGVARLLPPGGEHRGVRLLDRMATARTELVPRDGPPTPCGSFSGSRFRCGPDGWMQVGRAVARVGGRTTSCLWAHPQEGRSLRITFPDVPLGATLRGTAALIDGTGAGDDVNIEVRVGGESAGSVRVPGKGGAPTELAIVTERWRGQQADVSLTVSAKSARWRQVCLDPVVDLGGADDDAKGASAGGPRP